MVLSVSSETVANTQNSEQDQIKELQKQNRSKDLIIALLAVIFAGAGIFFIVLFIQSVFKMSILGDG
jgi:hypothetical protein